MWKVLISLYCLVQHQMYLCYKALLQLVYSTWRWIKMWIFWKHCWGNKLKHHSVNGGLPLVPATWSRLDIYSTYKRMDRNDKAVHKANTKWKPYVSRPEGKNDLFFFFIYILYILSSVSASVFTMFITLSEGGSTTTKKTCLIKMG